MDGTFPALDPKKCLRTYGKADKSSPKLSEDSKPVNMEISTSPKTPEKNHLTTKTAMEFLLEGTLKSKVCRYCLNVVSELSHLDQILEVAGRGTFYKVAIKDIVASFYPFKVADDPNFPSKICENCLNHAISSYLFTQQCEQAERALRNCFENIYDKLCKLDPLERIKKRGRQKLNPNYNTIHAEHEKVMDYAEPVIHLVHTTSEVLTDECPISDLECLKCCEVLPNLDSLINHMKTHPASMWYNCRLCGTSFAKRHHLKKHINTKHVAKPPKKDKKFEYTCKTCDIVFEKCSEYLLHIEKHKFKTVMKYIVEKKIDRLCALCFNKGSKMVQLDETISFHGVCPELSGDKSLRTILGYTLPQIHLDTYVGTKICEKCYNNALASYVFIANCSFARNRVGTCVTAMLEKLDTTESDNNICVEIATNVIVNVAYDEPVEDDDDDELKIEVLEDEFRIKSEDESDTEIKTEPEPAIDNLDKTKPLLNGYKYANQICGEFLTFKKKKIKRQKFTCPICFKHFISDYFLKKHCLKHASKIVECDDCKLKFNSKFQLFEHKKVTHTLKKSDYVTCKICQRIYTDERKLELHKERHKNPNCQICGKKFKSQTTFIYHMRRHMKKSSVTLKKYKQYCSFCEKDCSNDNEFSLHVNKVHLQIKPYSCDMCDQHFYTEYNLRYHRRLHSVFSKEKCGFCDKVLYSRKKLVIHIRKHIGDRPFCCPVCDKSFYSQLQLKKHLIALHGGKFCCKMCKTIFVTKKELNCHMNKVHNMI